MKTIRPLSSLFVSACGPRTSHPDAARREPAAARFVAALFAWAVVGFASGPALAQCLPASPLVNGDTVTCTGNIGTTYPFPFDVDGDPVDNITVVIDAGTTISTVGDGIQLNDLSRVDNSGSLFVNGPESAAIRSGNGASNALSPISNLLGGSIVVAADRAFGIRTGNLVAIENAGSITVDGDESRAIFIGNGVVNSRSIVTNDSTGVITLNGATGFGILGGTFVDAFNLGRIELVGSDGIGVAAGANGRLVNASTGTIAITGNGGWAMDVGTVGAIENQGTITVAGDDSRGLVSIDRGSSSRAQLSNTATGSITVTGTDSYGLYADSSAQLGNFGVLTVQGTRAIGMHGGANSRATHTGTLQVGAVDAVGIEVQPFDSSLPTQTASTFYNVWNRNDAANGRIGTITSTNPDAGPLVRLLPSGGGPGAFLHRVRNDSGASILADPTLLGTAGRAIAILGSSGQDEISNAGSIQGIVDLGDGTDVYSQAATGSIAFLAPGVLDGGAGIDTLRLNAASSQLGLFTADAARNFETLQVQGYWSVRGTASAPPGGLSMTVAPGATLRLDAPLFVDGSVMLTPPASGQAPASVQAVLGASTSGLSQILHSTGATTIDTGTLDILVNSLVGTHTFTILRSDTDLVGQFASVNLPYDPGLSFGALIYDDLAHTLSLSVAAAGFTPNETAVSNYLGAVEATGASPELQAIIDGLDTLPYSSYGAALDQLHPEAYDAHTTQTLELAHRFTELMLERPRVCVAARGEQKIDPRTQLVCREHRFEPWLAIYGQLGNRTGSTGHISYDDQGTGLVAGLDHRISDRLLVTGTIGTSYDSLDVDAVGVGRFTTLDLGLYAGYTRGPLRVQGVFSYGHGWQSRFRNISIPGFARTSTGEWGSDRIGTTLAGEYAFDLRGWTLAPMASIDYTALLQDSIYETGALPVSLQIDSRTDNIVTLRAGFEVATAWHKRDYWTDALETVDGVWRPNLSVQWRQVVAGADRALTADFIGDPGTAAGQFTVYGQSPSEGFEVGAGLDWTPRAANRLTFGLRYDVFVWTDVLSQDLTANVRYSF